MSVESKEAVESMKSTNDEPKKSKKKGVLSRLWNAIFRSRGDDFEKRLEHISKEERAALKRLENRRQLLHKMTRHFFFCVLLLEIIAVSYAIVTTRSEALNWKTRASCVLPMFLLPPGSFMVYSFIKWVFRILDQKDQKTVERLRAERRAKIDELKEKTNYYSTQQLIQRYDPDPAAKAAAATVLASKLGVESGLKVQLTENVDPNPASGKSNDVEVSRTGGLRHRKQPLSRSASLDSGSAVVEANLGGNGFNGAEGSQQNPLVVEHHPQTSSTSNNGGWLAQLAALLVGEDPTQSYALICGNCRMHNGLARKEDFPYITYYCPHCRALNRPNDADETQIPASASSPLSASLPGVEVVGETEETVSSTDKHSGPPDPAPAPATAPAPPNLVLGSS